MQQSRKFLFLLANIFFIWRCPAWQTMHTGAIRSFSNARKATNTLGICPGREQNAGLLLGGRLHVVDHILCLALPEKYLVALLVVYDDHFSIKLLELFGYLLIVR